jgi:ABC-type sugar transport system substrate-binding protein
MRSQGGPQERRRLTCTRRVIGIWITALVVATPLTSVGVRALGAAESADARGALLHPVKARRPYRIGVTVVHFVDDYWKGVAYGISDEAARSEVKIVRFLSAEGYGNVEQQLDQLDQLGTLEVDAVILGAANYDGYDHVIANLTHRGIKVIAVGVPVNARTVSFGVTMNEEEIGKAIASYMCKADRSPPQVITIPGPSGSTWNKLRLDGVEAGAHSCSGMRLVGNVFKGNTLIEDGEAQASDLLIKYPQAEFIYAAAANLGTGAAIAARRMNRNTRVVTATITSKSLDLMRSGNIAMVISEPGILIGRLALENTVRLLDHQPPAAMVDKKPVPYPQLLVPLYPVTSDQLNSYDVTKYDRPPPQWSPSANQH